MTANINDIIAIKTDSGEAIVSVVKIKASKSGQAQIWGRDLTTANDMIVFSVENISRVICSGDQEIAAHIYSTFGLMQSSPSHGA